MQNVSNTSSKNEELPQKPSFYLLHCLGWCGYVVIFSFDNILFTYNEKVSFGIIIPLIFSGTAAALFTLPLRSVYRKCWHLKAKQLIVTIALASFVVAVLWTPTKNAMMYLFMKAPNVKQWMDYLRVLDHDVWGHLNGLSYSFFMILVWSTLYFGINYHYHLIREKQRVLDAVRLSHSAQIKMLRYQINPHFLFNTLNAISTLVMMGNKEKANGMLVRLSTFLRFSLDNDPEKKIPLHEEIKASMLYLEIERARFEDRLSIELRVEDKAEALLVPSLILQPLIENSIKYAIAHLASEGLIKISAKCIDGFLQLQVSDNGPLAQSDIQQKLDGSDSSGHKGVGLSNIRQRLEVLYPQAHEFKVGQCQPQGFEVTMSIPMERL